MKAIEDAYKPYMMQHKYPFVCLQYNIQGDEVDVNVHPTKMEVRFQNQQAVYQATYEALTSVLAHRELIPTLILTRERTRRSRNAAAESQTARNPLNRDEEQAFPIHRRSRNHTFYTPQQNTGFIARENDRIVRNGT